MEEIEKLLLLADAIAPLKPVFGPYCALRKTDDNHLSQWPDSEIERLLVWLREKPGVIGYRRPYEEKWEQLGHGIKTPMTEETAKRRDEAFQPGDFKIIKKPGFDNWRAALKLKKAANVSKLSPLNFEKVWITVLEIEDRLEMGMNPRIILPMRFGRYTDLIDDSKYHLTGPYRMEALHFLANAGAIIGSIAKGTDAVEIYLDISKFNDFKATIEATRVARRDLRPDGKAKSGVDETPKAVQNESGDHAEIIYRAEYTSNREVIVNGFLLCTPDFESDNDRLLRFLMANPNRAIKRSDIPKDVLDGNAAKKDFHKFAENTGFRGDLRKAFFSISKTGILFRNPVGPAELGSVGLSRLRFPSARQKPS